jgi:N-sulfoglucosamine sulfohydrolase
MEEWSMPNSFGNKSEGYQGVKTVVYDPKDVIVPDFLPDTKECREELAEYYQSVSRIDQGFGKLMEYLENSGKKDNTIVIYISDNGIAFPGAKTTLYEPGIKLPCIISNPFEKTKNLVNNAMISWVDITPTILDMAGVNISGMDFHGRSFKRILGEENPEGWDEVFASHTFHEITMYYPMRVLRDKNYKLIWNIAYGLDYPFASDLWASSTWQSIYINNSEFYGQRTVKAYLNRQEFELYDLEKDPGEIKNLAYDQTYRSLLDEMQQRLKDKQRATSDPWLIIWEHDAQLQGSGVNL